MTWTPDRDATPRRRRRSGGSQDHSWSPSPEPDTAHDAWPHDRMPYEAWTHDELARQLADSHRLGIPRIIGRRARWVGARLRRVG